MTDDRRKMLEDLRDRLGKATGPDRILDAAIHRDIRGLCLHGNKTWSAYQSDTGFTCDDCGADSWGNRGRDGQKLHDAIPAYTGSRDAAVTLVPPWAEYTLSTLYGIADFECPLNAGDAGPQSFSVRRKDGNVILAICQWRAEYELAQLSEERT